MKTYVELADELKDKFYPYAFKCGCKGEHPDCQDAMNTSAVWSQYDTVNRIAKYIISLGDVN